MELGWFDFFIPDSYNDGGESPGGTHIDAFVFVAWCTRATIGRMTRGYLTPYLSFGPGAAGSYQGIKSRLEVYMSRKALVGYRFAHWRLVRDVMAKGSSGGKFGLDLPDRIE